MEKDYQIYTDMLGITLVNDSRLYADIKFYCKNLARKQVKNLYDRNKAIKGFLPIVKKGLILYIKEFCPSDKWYELATPSERLEIAEYMLDYHQNLIETYKQQILNK